MRKTGIGLLGLVLSLTLIVSGCARSGNAAETGAAEERLNLVATTTMLADLSERIGGDYVLVDSLMGPGVDPHLYQASAGDVTLLQEADVVLYNGLHLEGKMGDVFASLQTVGNAVICMENGLEKSKLLEWEEETSIFDPHIWFDVSLWKDAANYLTDRLSVMEPSHAADFAANLSQYLGELDELEAYVENKIAEVPEAQRVLITAHDAFHYFGNAYQFEVKGLQGISTETEAGTSTVSELAEFIAEKKIKAIFVESSVPTKTIEALQEAVKAKDFQVEIGGELYSDSLGGEGSGAETYILTVKANVDTIVNALK